MDFFAFPYEIRLMIYSELLVRSDPIVPPWPPDFRLKREGLCPALLEVNKKVHSEASPLLYSSNRFRFLHFNFLTSNAHIAPFLRQIGSQANLIRHICISFPSTFIYFRRRRARIRKAHIRNLELIRDTCTSITTLELSLPSDCDFPVAQEELDLLDALDARFKAIPSLKEINVNFRVYGEKDLGDDQMKMKMRDRGWTVGVTKLPKKSWTYDDDRFEFYNEKDCQAYDDEQSLLDWRREKEKESQWWMEKYFRRWNE